LLVDGPYMQALKSFEKRVVYSNIANDLQVGFTSGAILASNPYTKFPLSDKNYYAKYPHLINSSTVPNVENTNSIQLQPATQEVQNQVQDQEQKQVQQQVQEVQKQVQQQVQEVQNQVQELFAGDSKSSLLKTILKNLHTISWERFATHFLSPFGHDFIIGRFDFAKDVVEHTADNFLV